MNRCNISFAISRVEDCLELNFKYIDYQTLAHLSYSSCVCLTSVRTARVQRFLSVRVLISDSTCVLALDSSPQQTVFPWQHGPCPPPWRRVVLKCVAQGENQVKAPTTRQMGQHITTVQLYQSIVQKSCHLPTPTTRN